MWRPLGAIYREAIDPHTRLAARRRERLEVRRLCPPRTPLQQIVPILPPRLTLLAPEG